MAQELFDIDRKDGQDTPSVPTSDEQKQGLFELHKLQFDGNEHDVKLFKKGNTPNLPKNELQVIKTVDKVSVPRATLVRMREIQTATAHERDVLADAFRRVVFFLLGATEKGEDFTKVSEYFKSSIGSVPDKQKISMGDIAWDVIRGKVPTGAMISVYQSFRNDAFQGIDLQQLYEVCQNNHIPLNDFMPLIEPFLPPQVRAQLASNE